LSLRDQDLRVGLFADPILANSALDRLANGAHQLVIEGPSYRAKLAPRSPVGIHALNTATIIHGWLNDCRDHWLINPAIDSAGSIPAAAPSAPATAYLPDRLSGTVPQQERNSPASTAVGGGSPSS
jgi:hypothetical protein